MECPDKEASPDFYVSETGGSMSSPMIRIPRITPGKWLGTWVTGTRSGLIRSITSPEAKAARTARHGKPCTGRGNRLLVALKANYGLQSSVGTRTVPQSGKDPTLMSGMVA